MTVGLSYHWLKLISLWVVNIEPVLASLFDSTLGFGDLTSHSTLPSVPHCTAEDPYLESTAAIVVDVDLILPRDTWGYFTAPAKDYQVLKITDSTRAHPNLDNTGIAHSLSFSRR